MRSNVPRSPLHSKKIGLPCAIDTINHAEPVSHIAIQFNRCECIAVSITANRINDSACSGGGC
jgi:hypothetical protein